jgi:hypothetical protein
MRRALCLIREALVYRRAAFLSGLRAAGYVSVATLPNPTPDDVLVIWNRYGANDVTAAQFEHAGARVVVVENGYMGKSWLGDRWFALALGQHAGAGTWVRGDDARWDSLGLAPAPWREGGTETIILAQRGIGSPIVRSPDGWAQSVQRRIGGRIRAHPGRHAPTVALDDDLRDATSVVTWASTAALAALMLGVPVWAATPWWIGVPACKSLDLYGEEPRRDDVARLRVFRDMMWAMWRASEVEDGSAFQHLLGQR